MAGGGGWARLVVAMLIAAVLVTGCGGASGGNFASRAERVCSDWHKKLLAANPVPGNAGINQQAAAFEGMAAGLRQIPPPSDKRSAYLRLIADFEAVAAAQRSAAATNDPVKLAGILLQERTAFAGVRADGARAGLSTCAAQVTTG